jgi:hypothetical protein
MSWGNAIACFVWITMIGLVIALGVLMFLNCVPMWSGIELTRLLSIGYFMLTIFNLAFLFVIQKTTTYGQKAETGPLRVIILIYALAMLILGIVILSIQLNLNE